MITCPKCKATLPPSRVNCQFCGADTSKVERPKEVKRESRGYVASKAVWVWYTVICIYWALSGVINVFFAASNDEPIGIVFGAFDIAIGLGMLLRVSIFRGIAHIFCWINLVKGLCFILGGLLGSTLFGPIAFIACVIGFLAVVTSAGMIYLIGEPSPTSAGRYFSGTIKPQRVRITSLDAPDRSRKNPAISAVP